MTDVYQDGHHLADQWPKQTERGWIHKNGTATPYRLDGYEVVDARSLPETLRGHVERFLLDNRHLHTMGGSARQCSSASGMFLTGLLAAGYVEGDPGLNWRNDEVAVVHGQSHWAAEVDEWIIDFTARQFSMTAPWPLIWRKIQ